MNNILLTVIRDNSFTSAAMKYPIAVNNHGVGSLSIGQSLACHVNEEQHVLKVSVIGNNLTLHKMEKEVVLFPKYCKTGKINCYITTQINWIGMLTLGLLQAVGKIEIRVEYA